MESMRTLLVCLLIAGLITPRNLIAEMQSTAPPTREAATAQPVTLPPAGTGPVIRTIELSFPTQGNVPNIDAQTYLYYIQTKPSTPSQGTWVPFNEAAEKVLLEDFDRLWRTNFLDDLSIDVRDAPYPNGVIGKHITFVMEERQRVKIVDYQGTKLLESTKIDEKLREEASQIRLDSFIDPALVRKVEGIIRGMLAEKGHLDARVTHEIKPVDGGPKLVNLTFNIDEGPKIRIRAVDFVGNQAIGDGTLKKRMKENKQEHWLSFITGRGTYRDDKFAEDAEKVVEYYRDRGYIAIRVGQPEIKTLADSPDKKRRYVALRIPIEEGQRYRIGNFDFAGNTVVKSEVLRPLFGKLKEGDFYAEKHVRKGMEKAREVYGSGGYFEFTGYPDLQPRDTAPAAGAGAPGTSDSSSSAGNAEGNSTTPSNGATAPQLAVSSQSKNRGNPIVDVTMRLQEGQQYFVNRITFTGNNTTRDHVIRREMRVFENGVFNTEALKNSVKRLNQLGYFKNLEGEAIGVEKTQNSTNQVDVRLKLEEQNRNQLTFGAGVSQYEGFFGQLSFQTANFMGRGETLSMAIQGGERAHNYQLAFTEPFLFDRPITGGVDIYKRQLRYVNQFTQDSVGGNIMFGFPLADFTRSFITYSYEQVQVKDLNELYLQPEVIQGNPFLQDALLIGVGGRRTISKIAPSLVMNTVDSPIFPTSGKRYTAGLEVAGIGGDTNFLKPRGEAIWYIRHTNRTSVGLRAQAEYVRPYAGTEVLPIFERLFLGGEYSVRGYDIRSIGPRDPISGLVIGGTKSVLFNAEYLISVGGPVRLVLYYDAGQVQDKGVSFNMNDFVTSTGTEVRFFMPVLNVPFRLIFAYNPDREGVLDNNLQPAKKFTFRFAVGSTF